MRFEQGRGRCQPSILRFIDHRTLSTNWLHLLWSNQLLFFFDKTTLAIFFSYNNDDSVESILLLISSDGKTSRETVYNVRTASNHVLFSYTKFIFVKHFFYERWFRMLIQLAWSIHDSLVSSLIDEDEEKRSMCSFSYSSLPWIRCNYFSIH